jgi:ribosomal protein S9
MIDGGLEPARASAGETPIVINKSDNPSARQRRLQSFMIEVGICVRRSEKKIAIKIRVNLGGAIGVQIQLAG